ncbi:PREDICTED: uncharacterized protein LOC109152429 isoform X1 [Ipomoea nil]|uniref:uncharacterized protein LOC109152429 isoform X1 n=1 Tax=Ipomoea nil TaxID=35883 RepID=UPI000901C468|nr:PREDICTED: uncharacterized protein LOC109152429 isoform X1 [Ipomoea nil]
MLGNLITPSSGSSRVEVKVQLCLLRGLTRMTLKIRSGVLLRIILVVVERLKVSDFQRTLKGTLKGMPSGFRMLCLDPLQLKFQLPTSIVLMNMKIIIHLYVHRIVYILVSSLTYFKNNLITLHFCNSILYCEKYSSILNI